jgi:SAM-dependent methyltransferase
MSERDFDPKTYWEARLRARFSLRNVGHRKLGHSFNRWAYRVRGRVFKRSVRPLLGPAPAVLDVGSGTGFYLDAWRELGAGSVTGSDLTEVAVRRLRSRFPSLDLVQLDIGADGAPSGLGPFDAISAMDVLFHLVDDDAYRRAFTNLAAMLRPGGLLVFSEDFVRGERSAVPHRVSRPIGDVESAVRGAGLEPILRRPVFFLMNTPLDAEAGPLDWWWRKFSATRFVFGRSGAVAGAALYPVELALGRTLKEGPSTELMICRKPS